MQTTTAIRLPVVAYEGKNWFFDARLRQIRNIDNPHDYQDLNDFEVESFKESVRSIRSITWKDEGRDSEGRSVGPASAEDATGKIVHNYGWLTWAQAEHAAQAFGIDLHEV